MRNLKYGGDAKRGGEEREKGREERKEKKRKNGNYIYTPGIINIELCNLVGKQAVSLVFL